MLNKKRKDFNMIMEIVCKNILCTWNLCKGNDMWVHVHQCIRVKYYKCKTILTAWQGARVKLVY